MTEEAGEKKIVVVAVDESPQAEYALKYYATEVHNPENRVILLYVTEAPGLLGQYESQNRYMTSEVWEDIVKAGERQAAEMKTKFSQKLKEHQMTAEMRTIFHSKAGEAISDEAKKLGATLIVMGTRGMGKVRRTVFGSVSDYVLHHAHCSVLISRM